MIDLQGNAAAFRVKKQEQDALICPLLPDFSAEIAADQAGGAERAVKVILLPANHRGGLWRVDFRHGCWCRRTVGDDRSRFVGGHACGRFDGLMGRWRGTGAGGYQEYAKNTETA